MATFIDIEKEEVRDYNGGEVRQYLNQSGLFEDVTIAAAWFNKSPTGKSESIGVLLEKDGNTQIEFDALKMVNYDGSINNIGQKSINELCYAVGLDNGIKDLAREPDETMELPVGKGGAMVEVECFSQLCDVNVSYLRLVKYGEYNGNIKENVNFKYFYNNDTKASAVESVKLSLGEDVEVGTKFAKDKEYYAAIEDATNYGAFTKEQIKAWIKARRPKGTAGKASAAAKPAGKKPVFRKPLHKAE